MFSFLFFTLYIYIFELARKGNNKPLFLIPLITILWNNIHGGVVAGIGLMGMYALGEFLNRRPYKKYLLTLVISAITLFINPWGYEYIKFLLMANTMERTHIVEWWGLFSKYHLFKQIPFKLFMLGSLAVESVYIFKNIKSEGFKQWYNNADKVKYIVLLSTLYLAISHVKLLPFFAIASVCFIYEDFYKLIGNVELPKWKDKAVYILLIAVSIFTLSAKEISLPVGLKNYPVKEVEFVKINNLKGRILVNFGLGSYVSYKLYPDNLIFMDGRYEEVYYDYMVPMLKEFCLAYPHWKEILEYFPPDIIIIENYYPIYNVLKASNDWKLVYEGDIFGVFVPKDKASEKFKMPTNDINYYKNTLFNTGINFN